MLHNFFIKYESLILNLCINNQQICKVASCGKYLGVIIDESLNWNEHIAYIFQKLLKFTGIFYKMRDILPFACLSQLYYAFIHPHILYGIEVYANASKSALDKLLKLNNKLLWILLNKKLSTPVRDLYATFNILPIPILHEMQMLMFIHKCLYHKNILPNIFHSYFIMQFINIIQEHVMTCTFHLCGQGLDSGHLSFVDVNFGMIFLTF